MRAKRIPFRGRGTADTECESPSDVLVRPRRGPRRRRLLLAGAACVVALSACAMVVAGLQAAPRPAPMPPRTFALPPSAVPDPVTESAPKVWNVPEKSTAPSTTPPPTRVPPGTPEPDAARPQVPDGPVEAHMLYVPALGIRAHVASTGVIDGLLQIPANVSEVTMWDGSARLDASTGTVLVAGHVDNVHQGEGALWSLHQVRAGDAVYLTDEDRTTRWKVVGVESVVKSALPQAVWAGPQGERVLKLVTCGGKIVHGNYLNNVIVTAVPF